MLVLRRCVQSFYTIVYNKFNSQKKLLCGYIMYSVLSADWNLIAFHGIVLIPPLPTSTLLSSAAAPVDFCTELC